MTFVLRSLVLALASFGLATLISSTVVALIWRTPDGAAAHRAGRLWLMRILPTLAGIATGLFVAMALWRFEGRHNDEHIGWVVRVGAALCALFLGTLCARLLRMHLATRRLLSAWLANSTRCDSTVAPGLSHLTVPAYRIETNFPVVAVVGIIRPVLVLDATVLDSCSPDQLTAILAHEQGHLRRWDNLRRAMFASAPDLLGWTSIGPALRTAWREATEEAADDVAAEMGEDARVHLADALIRVARIAQSTAAGATAAFRTTQLPASALYRGECIERRVHRLLHPVETVPAPRHPMSLVILTSALVLAFMFQRDIHHLLELAVNGLW